MAQIAFNLEIGFKAEAELFALLKVSPNLRVNAASDR